MICFGFRKNTMTSKQQGTGGGGREQVKILKGAVDGLLKSAHPGVNEARA